MKKVLLVTYYWPPAGGPGVQRWLKFVTHLPEFGIEPVVYVPENPEYPQTDDSLLDELPGNVKIYRGKIREPLRWVKRFGGKKTRQMSAGQLPGKEAGTFERLMMWGRANLLIPDARIFWVQPSIKRLNEILEQEKIDTLVTTGPPHSVHLIGLGLKNNRSIRWIADFRDPWTRISYHADLPLGTRAKHRHEQLEAKVLRGADEVIATSHTTAREFAQKYDREVRVVTNGYDREHYEAVDASPDDHFSLSHIGSLLRERNPGALWQALKELREEREDFRRDFRLRFAGTVSVEVRQELERYELTACSDFLGYVSHTKAIALQKASQCLLLVEIDREETRGIIPGKLFEYLASGRPVLAIGPDSWEGGEMIQESGNGHFFQYHEAGPIKEQVAKWYGYYREGALSAGPADPSAFTRRNLSKELANLL